MTKAHTATPWREEAAPCGYIWAICNPDNAVIRVESNNKANAAFIVTACNAHDDLVKALQQCFDYPKEVFDLGDDEIFTMSITGRHLHLVRDALEKAGAA